LPAESAVNEFGLDKDIVAAPEKENKKRRKLIARKHNHQKQLPCPVAAPLAAHSLPPVAVAV